LVDEVNFDVNNFQLQLYKDFNKVLFWSGTFHEISEIESESNINVSKCENNQYWFESIEKEAEPFKWVKPKEK
jgi:hypothetical protein